jgi:hypothetical protein
MCKSDGRSCTSSNCVQTINTDDGKQENKHRLYDRKPQTHTDAMSIGDVTSTEPSDTLINETVSNASNEIIVDDSSTVSRRCLVP